MKKLDIARSLARKSGVSRAEAADRLDVMVHQILTDLRKGQETELPGMGRFSQGADGQILFRRQEKRKRG